MILYKCLILIVLLNSFVTTEKSMKHCFYSRYMYYAFQIHNIFFKTKFAGDKDDSLILGELKMYGESLQSQSQNVLLILDDLMTENYQLPSFPEDMMTINLYLNNVSNTLMVRTYDGKHEDGKDMTKSHKEEFKKYMDKILDLLGKSIGKTCHWGYTPSKIDIVGRNSKELNVTLGYDKLNNLLPNKFSLEFNKKNSIKSIEEHMDVYFDSVMEMDYLMKPILSRQTYMRYHPKRMLFYDMLIRGKNNIDLINLIKESETDDLELMRSVTLETKLEDGAYPNIDILFSMAQRVFDIQCIRSFQQQVLATTAHPVLMVICSYLGLVKNMFYTGDKKFKDVATMAELLKKKRINDLGESILNTFVSFIRLSLYPKKVLNYFKLIALELDNLVKYNNKENLQLVRPKWLGQILRRCTTPMLVNKLRVAEIDEFVSVSSAENCNNSIKMLKLKIEKVGKHVNDLEKYKHFYNEITINNPFFFHEDMLLDEPLYDIINKNKYGYSILVGNRAIVKLDDEPHLLND